MEAIEFKGQNVVIAKDQHQYRALPSLKIQVPRLELMDPDGHVIFCQRLCFRERIKVLFTGKIWVSLMTFGKLTPSYLSTRRKDMFSLNWDSVPMKEKFRIFINLGAIIYSDI